jgi:NAD+ kinase
LKIKRVGLIVKKNSPTARDLAIKAVTYMNQSKGWRVITAKSDDILPESWTFRTEQVDPEKMYGQCDIFVVLGGDGTMLQAASYTQDIKETPLPVLGINLGRVGYLSTIPAQSLFEELDRLESNNNNLVMRNMLSVKDPYQDHTYYPVLNEVVLHWSQKARLINLYLAIDGDGEFEIRADGIIISTPTGSTAYNYAAGGPLVHHDVDALIVTPICPFSGLKGSLMLPMTSGINIKSDERNSQVSVTIDGYRDFLLENSSTLRIDKNLTPFVLINPRISSYLEVLQTKLNIVGNRKE